MGDLDVEDLEVAKLRAAFEAKDAVLAFNAAGADMNASSAERDRLFNAGRRLHELGGDELMSDVSYSMFEEKHAEGILLGSVWSGIWARYR